MRTRYDQKTNMKKMLILFFIILFSVLFVTSCKQKAAQDADIVEDMATATEMPLTQTDAAESQIKFTPSDILGESLNPLYELKFPESFILESVLIHTPGCDTNGNETQYHMNLLAQKDNETIIAMASILGETSKDVINNYIETIQREGKVTINGYKIEGGMDYICEVRTTPKDNGWVVEVVTAIDKENEKKYKKFIEDNYNMNVLGMVSKYTELMPVPDQFRIDICYVDVEDLMKTDFEVVYAVEDKPAIMDNIFTDGGYDWYDSGNKKFGFDYGDLKGDIRFTEIKNQIVIHQSCKGIPSTPLSEYSSKPILTMDTYGFNFNADTGISLYEARGEHYSKLGFHSPEWGEMEDTWGFEFLYPLNGGYLVTWFRPEENRFDIRIEKGDDVASYAYNAEKNVFEAMFPDKETVDKCLNNLYADPSIDDLYARVFEILDQYSLDISGKEFSQLALLPPIEGSGFAPIPALPTLPKAGTSRTTLSTLGFQFKEYGSWGYYDEKSRASIDIYRDAWSTQTDEWNRNVIWYYQVLNGHLLAIAYYPDSSKYDVQIYEGSEPSEPGVQAFFGYDAKNEVVLEKNTMGTDLETEEVFAEMLGIQQTSTIYADVLSIFDQYTSKQFSRTPEELYQLDTE